MRTRQPQVPPPARSLNEAKFIARDGFPSASQDFVKMTEVYAEVPRGAFLSFVMIAELINEGPAPLRPRDSKSVRAGERLARSRS